MLGNKSIDDKEIHLEEVKNELRILDEEIERKNILRDRVPDYYEKIVDDHIKKIVDDLIRNNSAVDIINRRLQNEGYYAINNKNFRLERVFLKIPSRMRDKNNIVRTIKKEINYYKTYFPELEKKLLGEKVDFDQIKIKELKKILANLRITINQKAKSQGSFAFVPKAASDSSYDSELEDEHKYDNYPRELVGERVGDETPRRYDAESPATDSSYVPSERSEESESEYSESEYSDYL